MPTIALTDIAVQRLAPQEKQVIWWDPKRGSACELAINRSPNAWSFTGCLNS
jgi:hypothetical protein